MEKQPKRFGDYIKELRRSRDLTLKQVSDFLEISLSLLSDIESNRRKPLENEKLDLFATLLSLSKHERNCLYDFAGRENGKIPQDIENTMMYTEAGDMARLALRKTKNGEITVEDWKRFIQYEEEGDC